MRRDHGIVQTGPSGKRGMRLGSREGGNAIKFVRPRSEKKGNFWGRECGSDLGNFLKKN